MKQTFEYFLNAQPHCVITDDGSYRGTGTSDNGLTAKNEETKKIFIRQHSRKLPRNIQQIALRKLRMLNRAMTVEDLRVPPANRVEKLHGNREGQWSIRINDQWRVCFEWRDKDAYNVEIVDYH